MGKGAPLLSVRDLVVEFSTLAGPVRVIDRISFDVFPNEVFCIVGESGSGKSITMLAVLGLLPRAARVTAGKVLFKDRDITSLNAKELRTIRGRDIAMIFQDPMTSMNPVMKVGRQLAEMVRLHRPELSREAIRRRVVDLLGQVGLPNPESISSSFPHELSGGMRQRAMIGMAMAHNPALLIADEPTTALDVTTQAQVLDVLREMREGAGSSLALITHDLGIVAENADRVIVMYSGRILESATAHELFGDPRHPYSVGLMASLLYVDRQADTAYAIKGQPPTPQNRPSGCTFHPRCGLARTPACMEVEPELVRQLGEHMAACHFSDEVPAWVRSGSEREVVGGFEIEGSQ